MIKNPSSNAGEVGLIPSGGAKHTAKKTQHSQQQWFIWGKVKVHKNAHQWKKTNYGKCQVSQVALVVKNLCANAEDPIPGSGRSPGGGKRQPTPVFLPGGSYGQRSLAGYSPQGCKESDTMRQLSKHMERVIWRDSHQMIYNSNTRNGLKCK